MPTLKEIINAAKKEPNSDRSLRLRAAIVSGKMDSMAQSEGIDLSGFKQAEHAAISQSDPDLGHALIKKAGSFLANPSQAVEGAALDIARKSATPVLKTAVEYGKTITPEQAKLDKQAEAQREATRQSQIARQQVAGQKASSAGVTMPSEFKNQQGQTITDEEEQTKAREEFASTVESAARAQNPMTFAAGKIGEAAGQALQQGAEGLQEMATAGKDTVKMAEGFGKVANAPVGIVSAPVSAALAVAPQPVQDLANQAMQIPANLGAAAAKNVLTGDIDGIPGIDKLDLVPGGSAARSIFQKLRQAAGQNSEIDVNSDEYKKGVEEPLKNAVNFLMAKQAIQNPKAIKEAPREAVEYFGDKTGLKDLITKPVEQLRSEKMTKGLEEQNTRLKSVNQAFNDNTKVYKTVDGKPQKVTPIDTLSKNSIFPEIEKGTINMGDYKTGTGALGQIKAKVSNLDAEIDSQLVNSGIKISLQDLWEKAINKAKANPDFKAAGTVESTISKINKRFSDYVDSYGDTVDIAELNNIRKVANRDWSPDTIDTSRIVGDVARDEVYNATPDLSIKNMLKEQSELLAAKNYSIKLNGTKVTGGRLGNYAARTTGAVIGSTINTLPVAGPILGMLGGEYIARALQQSQFKSLGAEAKALFTPKKMFEKAEGKMPLDNAKITTPEANIQPPKQLPTAKLPEPKPGMRFDKDMSEVVPAVKTKTKKPKAALIDTINPTGSVFTEYNPKARATAKLAENITTLDKTLGGSPDDMITIYRGAPKSQTKINAGDFITTNKELAKDYAGNGNVISAKVRKGDILDDINEPLGEEYIYKPQQTKPQATIKKPNSL